MFSDIDYETKMGKIINNTEEMNLIKLKSMINSYNSVIYSDTFFDLENKKSYIQSLFLGFPSVPVFYHKDKHNKFIILDGNKRLDTIFCFLKNEFPINFNGKDLFFKNIDKSILTNIYIQFVNVGIESDKKNPEVKINTLKNILYSFGKKREDVDRIINFIKNKNE